MNVPNSLRAVPDVLPTGPGATESMLALVTELRERAEKAEAEAFEYRTALGHIAGMARTILAGTDAKDEWACSSLNLLAMRAERALETSDV